jgi:GMP synthase-like glutamine amidotransferase
MQIAILETGAPPPALAERFGRYPDMFRALLGEKLVGPSYDVTAGAYPAAPERHAAYLVTGSPAGVYEDLPWIEPLKGFLRSAKGKAKLVGVCFGHQLMAEAFGGRVEKSAKGWGVGLHRYAAREPAGWMDGGFQGEIAVPASHQDQVVALPPQATVIAGSAFCPYAMLAYRDQPAMSLQFHPEFEPAFAAALIEARRDRLPEADAAIASLSAPNDRERVGRWIRRFLADG